MLNFDKNGLGLIPERYWVLGRISNWVLFLITDMVSLRLLAAILSVDMAFPSEMKRGRKVSFACYVVSRRKKNIYNIDSVHTARMHACMHARPYRFFLIIYVRMYAWKDWKPLSDYCFPSLLKIPYLAMHLWQ